MSSAANPLQRVPKVDDLLRRPAVVALLGTYPRPLVLDALGGALDRLRGELREGRADGRPGELAERVEIDAAAHLRRSGGMRLRRVVNATGVVLHTGLGRAPLAPEAAAAAAEALGAYCLLEVDEESGKRGRRETGVAELLGRILGSEAATAVNNNAAATLLALNTVADGREAILSRGELVEIGGAFRMPEVMARSGARLVEVGTTNRTYLEDYRRAGTERTGCLLKVHRSNFRIEGFTHEVEIEELCALGRELRIPVLHDLGSGRILGEAGGVLRDEPLVQRSVRAGADLVFFSGDKLLGGPQAGVIVGTKESVERCRGNPLFRALRLDKATLAALEATLRIYLRGPSAAAEIPTLRMLLAPIEEVGAAAERIAAAIPRLGAEGLEVRVEDDDSRAGSGSAPEVPLPTRVVAIRAKGLSADALLARLREAEPPVFARIRDGRVALDPRTLLPGDEEALLAALRGALALV
ncbi:MAG TPA: L-seryl-tRNA(Sec) selenium transferase [Planctomycetota bacterium]|jgi:L-seryl-tRNA(Ser) seleniumtransferase|nr:L-seryl-tRNA(Sec) selenium transferase [Planctomycetota bacterium]